MKIIALDFGDVRVGLAIGDTNVGIAHARLFLPNDKRLLDNLRKFCELEKIGLIIVGWPVSLSGQSSGQTKKVKTFIEKLKAETELPIETIDERYSTVLAISNLKESDNPKKGVDSESARILLQEWLERKN